MITSLEDRLAVVTGAGSGIGREIAQLLAEEGMRLALIDIDGDRLDETARLLRDRGSADTALRTFMVNVTGRQTAVRTFCVDVTSRQAVAAAADDIVSADGVPALLVNSAGRLGPFDKMVWELSDADWQGVLSVDLFGPVNTVRVFLPGMRAAARPGHIVNIASIAGVLPERRAGAYGAAKHALVSFTETLHVQLAEENSPIGVSLVCPGAVPTNFNLALRGSDSPNGRANRDYLGPDIVARQILAAVRQPAFYVFTHPGSGERLRRYHDRLIAGSSPSRPTKEAEEEYGSGSRGWRLSLAGQQERRPLGRPSAGAGCPA